MAKNAASSLSPGTPLLLVLPCFLSSITCAGIDSLCCNLIVKSAIKAGQPWYEGRCSMNGKTLFQFNNESPVTPSGKLTKEENATEPCPVLPQSVKNILEVMRNQLRHIEPEQLKTMGNNTLQVTMISQYNQGQFTGAFCKFTIDGQSSFSFHPTKDIWTANGPDASSTMRPWEKNRELRQGLRRLLKGDFRHCYQKFLTLWRQTPRPTKKAWDTTHPTSAVQSRNMTWVVILCIAGLIFIKLVT